MMQEIENDTLTYEDIKRVLEAEAESYERESLYEELEFNDP